LEEVLNKEARDKNVSIKVVNMGVSGETSSGGLDRVDFVISQNPDLVLLGLGANDMLRATDPSLVKNNLEKIIKSFKGKNITVILLGMQSQVSNGINYKIDFDSIYPDLSKKYKLPLVPFFLEGVALVPNLNTSDGIHPNRSGYEKIIDENIMNVLLPYLEKIKLL
jgi:acyl-CoA thioesterase-1